MFHSIEPRRIEAGCAAPSLVRFFLLLLACLTALPLCGQEETPFTRLFDTGAASAQPWADEAIAKPVGWMLVPEDKVDHKFSGDTVLLNDKVAVVLRQQGRGAEVYSRAAGGVKYRATLGYVRTRLSTGESIAALRIMENTSGAVMVGVTFPSPGPAALHFRLTTGEAILELRSPEGVGFVHLQSMTRYVVVPDYFGDDMVFEALLTPSLSPSEGERVSLPAATVTQADERRVRGQPLALAAASPRRDLCLPAENFCLSLLEGGDAMVMSVWQSSEQEAWLTVPSSGPGGGFCSSTIQCLKGKSIWLAFLESPGLWHAGSASAKDDWRPPFPAKWRYSFVRENGVADSWTTEEPAGAGAGRSADFRALPLGQPTVKGAEGRASQGRLVAYPIDRSTATPLTASCPTDVMRNTLGVGPCQYILAVEGLASQGDPTPNSVMNWVEKQFEQKKEKKAAEDIRERLQQMAEHIAHAGWRIDRYSEYSVQVHKLLGNKEGAEPYRSIADDLDRVVADGRVATASRGRAQQLTVEVLALIGKENALPACRQLGEQLRSLGAVQDRTLAKCRMAVRRLKQAGRTLAINQPHTAGLAREVQQFAEQMLRRK